jgi:hypothetical protein
LFTPTVAIEKVRVVYAERWQDSGKIFHDSIPTFTVTYAEKQDHSFGHSPEIEVVGLIGPEPCQSKCLGQSNGEDQKEDEPSGKKVADICQTCSCRLEQLIQRIVPRNEQQDYQDQEGFVELNVGRLKEIRQQ